MEDKELVVRGAREHNLKNIDVNIPRGSLTVFTGLSGSGKSSLAFDTIFAEGQRRYIETFSAYARNYMDHVTRPDVDAITGLSPVISIDQKTTNRNPRSTVGTVTELYDFLRLLYARVGEAVSYVSGEKMVKYTEERILEMLVEDYGDKPVYLVAPLVRNRKGHYRELFESIRRKGFLYVRVDGEILDLLPGMKVDRYKTHHIEVVVDKLKVDAKDLDRLKKSVNVAFRMGEGLIGIVEKGSNTLRYYSKHLMDPVSGISYRDPSPHDFSFNSATGCCPHCKGLGTVNVIDREKVIPDDSLSIRAGGIVPLGKYKAAMIFWQIEAVLRNYDCSLDTPLSEIPESALTEILIGSESDLRITGEQMKKSDDLFVRFDGLVKYIQQMADREMTAAAQRWAEQFNTMKECPECHGARLNRQALHFFIDGKNIHDAVSMDLGTLYDWVRTLPKKLPSMKRPIAEEIVRELQTRLKFLLDVGLDYLSLSRSSVSLSGGESQRIRLATQIGSQLVNVLYILDEPSIGLHQRDNVRLIKSLKALRDIGNTVVVVEHDKDMMLHADYIVDLGPRAGRLGGEVVYQGKVKPMLKTQTLTARYLNGALKVCDHYRRRPSNGHAIRLLGATGNNLQHVDLTLPLGQLVCVTGVSGSGKSSLITDTLLPILSQRLYRSLQEPLPYERIEGLEFIDKLVSVDQSPIGRTLRSCPATYTNLFIDIRNLFVDLPEAQIRAYKPGRFSFNIGGGRCDTCKGNGYRSIEMNFLPNVLVPCEECHGKRYNRETLEVRFKGKSIADVLDMTIDEAVAFFENVPNILLKLRALQDVGLGYVTLGQSSTTLSGGESQRVKLATELSKRDTGHTLYILDEPTTGLHFEDIRVLMNVLDRLVDRGNTVLIIEHNLDVIKMADHVIDLGPEGGRGGGRILVTGTPEQVALSGVGHTARFLRQELGL